MRFLTLLALFTAYASHLALAAPSGLVARADTVYNIGINIGPQFVIKDGRASIGTASGTEEKHDWGGDVLGHVSRKIIVGGLGEQFDSIAGSWIQEQSFRYEEAFEADGVKQKAEPFKGVCFKKFAHRAPPGHHGAMTRSVEFTVPTAEAIRAAEAAGQAGRGGHRVEDADISFSCERSY